jgi:hypothetical protein
MSGPDKLYLNDHGRGFIDQTERYFPRTPWGSMGVKFFDFNLDGRMDLYVTDMHSDMTSAQIKAGDADLSPRFEKQKSDVWCSTEWPVTTQRYASNNILGNAFYRNEGEGRYREVSGEVGAETYWPWGITVADLNADGWEDVFVTAGMGYPLRYAVNSVLLNEAGQRFVNSEFVLGVEPRAGGRVEKEFFTLQCDGADRRHPLSRGRTGALTVLGATSSRGSVAFDLDDDGDLDVVTSDWNDRPQVFVSNLSERRPLHYLKLKLVGTKSNRDGLGALVTVTAGMKKFIRYHDGKSGYLAQSSLPLYFGLGEAQAIDQIEVRWPAGGKQVLNPIDLKINTTLTITEAR